jgi:hypothetical protein
MSNWRSVAFDTASWKFDVRRHARMSGLKGQCHGSTAHSKYAGT